MPPTDTSVKTEENDLNLANILSEASEDEENDGGLVNRKKSVVAAKKEEQQKQLKSEQNEDKKIRAEDLEKIEQEAEKENLDFEETGRRASQIEKIPREQRYQNLMKLLEKSQFYSDYLSKKLEAADEATKLREKKLEERKKLKEQREAELAKSNNSETAGKRKRGRNDDNDDAQVEEEAPKKGRRGRPPANKRVKKEEIKEEEEKAEVKTEDADTSLNTSQKIIRTWNGQDIPDEQPLLLTGGVMRDYQLKGYQWMASLYENGINGILGDEMGLGKTIQTISLICHLVEMGVAGPFLVVAPLSTVPNWVREFNRFAPSLPVLLYHGNADEREELRKKHLRKSKAIPEAGNKNVRYVFVTSYEICIRDRAFFQRELWRYVVVDEGHRLKNTQCRLITELKKYPSANRLLLTGTPLQNNLSELWSLLNFLMPDIFDDLSVFESWFNVNGMQTGDKDARSEAERILKQEQQENIITTLHKILTPFLLRRVKADVDLKIPPKKEVVVYCPMPPEQKDMYENIVSKTIQQIMGLKTGHEKELEETEEAAVAEAKEEMETGKRATRKSREARNKVDMKIFFSEDDDTGNVQKKLDKYLDTVQEIENHREQLKAKEAAKKVKVVCKDYEINVNTKNKMMDLRKSVNHPYLIRHPLSECGQFYRADQELIDICGKMKVLDQMLEELMARKEHKVLIFSQMTKCLDILGDYLDLKEWSYSRLDGSMPFEDRQENINNFNDDPECKLFLLSTRAGGLGINLTAADTVIIYDSDWNPQQDLQAQDRCHRIGQTKPVMIYRLVTANTIDQKIVERAAAKRRLEKLVIHSKKFKSQDKAGLAKTQEKIDPEELLELLKSNDHTGIVDRGQDGTKVFKKAELNRLLDRSDLTWAKVKEEEENAAKAVSELGGRKTTARNRKDKEMVKQENDDDLFKIVSVDIDGKPEGLLQSVNHK